MFKLIKFIQHIGDFRIPGIRGIVRKDTFVAGLHPLCDNGLRELFILQLQIDKNRRGLRAFC